MANRDFIGAVQAMAAEVQHFHERWQDVARVPHQKAHDVLRETLTLQREEVEELRCEIEAQGGALNLDAALEEAADVLFVALGTIYRMGIAGDEAVQKVIAKNSKKQTSNYYFDRERRKVRRIKSAN